jgi:hypothetical protein
MTQPPAKRGQTLKNIRHAMGRATEKYMAGGRLNPKRKPVTLTRADYDRQKGE